MRKLAHQLARGLAFVACLLAFAQAAAAADGFGLGLGRKGVAWRPDYSDAVGEAAKTGRLVLVHISASWCGPCKQMEKEVFSSPEAAQSIESQYVPIKLDFEDNAELMKKWNVQALPADLILLSDGKTIIHRRKGFEKGNGPQYLRELSDVASQVRQQQAGALAQRSPAAEDSTQGEVAYAPGRGAAVAPPMNPMPMNPMAPTGPTAPLGDPSRRPGELPLSAFSPPPPTTNNLTPPSAPVGSSIAGQPRAKDVPPAAAPPRPAAPAAEAPLQLPPGAPPLAMDGYCSVTLYNSRAWKRGNPAYGVIHHNKLYLFVSEADKAAFFAKPEVYAPAVGGNDPVLALDNGQYVAGTRHVGCYYRDRLFLFTSEETFERFNQNADRYANEAVQASRAVLR